MKALSKPTLEQNTASFTSTAPLNKINVLENGDLAVGKYVFKTNPGFIDKESRKYLYSDLLKANGYLDPYCIVDGVDGSGTSLIDGVKGVDVYIQLIGGKLRAVGRYELPKITNKYYAEIFGAGFDKRLWKIVYREWLGEFNEHLIDLGVSEVRGKGCFIGNNSKQVYMLRKSGHLVKEVITDGLIHIAPFVMLLRRSPKELKQLLGKGLWRKLCANSKTRNKQIAVCIMRLLSNAAHYRLALESSVGCGHVDAAILDLFAGAHGVVLVEILAQLNQLSSSYIPKINGNYIAGSNNGCQWHDSVASFVEHCVNKESLGLQRHQWINDVAKAERKLTVRRADGSGSFVDDLRALFDDSLMMAQELGAEINFSWSYKRMKREHDDMSFEMAKKDYTSEPFINTDKFPVCKEFNVGDDVALFELMNDSLSVGTMARRHRNCLAGFIPRLQVRDHLLYKVSIGERESACMFTLRGGNWIVIQHYFPFNIPVDQSFVKAEELMLDVIANNVDVSGLPEVGAGFPFGMNIAPDLSRNAHPFDPNNIPDF